MQQSELIGALGQASSSSLSSSSSSQQHQQAQLCEYTSYYLHALVFLGLYHPDYLHLTSSPTTPTGTNNITGGGSGTISLFDELSFGSPSNSADFEDDGVLQGTKRQRMGSDSSMSLVLSGSESPSSAGTSYSACTDCSAMSCTLHMAGACQGVSIMTTC